VSELHRTEVDGVPAFWVESGRPTLTASLVFRWGMVDETLPETGWTHLLEHLALHGRGGGALQVNGSVSLLHTRFDAHGPADRVSEVLTATAGWLAEPTLQELARERGVLRAESALRTGGEVGPALVWRYGARGPGLSGFAEPGLARATESDIASLAGTAFTRGNAALFLDGPPPPGLRLTLPEGPLRPAPVATPCDDVLPAAYLIRAGATVSGVVERSTAGTVAPHVLRELLTEQFRQRDGAAYAPWSHYEPVDDHTAVVLCGTDANDVLLETLAERVVQQVERLARGDVDESLVRNVVAQLEQFHQDPYNRPALAYRAVIDHLRQEPVTSLEEALAEVRAVDLAAVARAGAQLSETLLLGIARDATWNDPMPLLSMPARTEPVAGRRHRSRNFPADRQVLVVADDAVQLGAGRAWLTLQPDELVGVFAHPDGGRELVSRDGWTLRVEPTLWRGGAAAVERLDRLVDSDLHIPLERAADAVPRPLPLWRRLHHVVHGAPRGAVVGILLTLALLVLVVLAVTRGTGSLPVVGIVAGIGSALWSFLRERRRSPDQATSGEGARRT